MMAMATVYLPFGYPLLSGVEFNNVIYQGRVVRLYQIPTDPRTEAQLVQRKLFADIGKMRGTLGTWARGALICCLGSRWTGNLTQIMRADVESLYSSALAEWESFTTPGKAAWQTAAPFQATFNNQGAVWFALARVIYGSMVFYKGLDFLAQEWQEEDSAACLTWWTKDVNEAITKSTHEVEDALVTRSGYWENTAMAAASGGYLQRGAASLSAELSFYAYGKSGTVQYFKKWDSGDVELFVDGESKGTFSAKSAIQDEFYYGPFGSGWAFERKGLHHFRWVVKTLDWNADTVVVG